MGIPALLAKGYFYTVGTAYLIAVSAIRRLLRITIDRHAIPAQSTWVSCNESNKRPLAPLFLAITRIVLAPVGWLLACDAFVTRLMPKTKREKAAVLEQEISPFIYQMH